MNARDILIGLAQDWDVEAMVAYEDGQDALSDARCRVASFIHDVIDVMDYVVEHNAELIEGELVWLAEDECVDDYADYVARLPDWHFDWVPGMGPYGSV